jgi:hypothetical protein
MSRFVEVLKLGRFAVYVFDHGAPTGFRLATTHSQQISAIITQNGNARFELPYK